MASPNDDLAGRLEQLITELAAHDAPEIVTEARARARERARTVIEDALTEQLLQHAAGAPPQRHDPPAPAPAAPAPVTDQGTGIYVYGVVAGAPEELVEGLTGMDAEAGVTLIRSGEVSALCTRVPLAEFGEEALQRNLNRLDWLEATAVRHETVLDQLIGRAELIPFRLCTVFADASRVAAMLEAQRDVFLAALARLQGATEWGVKAVAEQPAPAGGVPGPAEEPDAASGEGTRYFASRRRARESVALARERLSSLAAEAHARLSEAARAATVHAPQSPELSGYAGQMILNGSYLVDDGHTDAFAALVGQLDERHRDEGVRFELTGPWPPYNFAGDPGEAGVTADAEPR